MHECRNPMPKKPELQPIVSYSDQLIAAAERVGVDLPDAFARAGIPTSTYYRSIKGPMSLTLQTATKVHRAIEQLRP